MIGKLHGAFGDNTHADLFSLGLGLGSLCASLAAIANLARSTTCALFLLEDHRVSSPPPSHIVAAATHCFQLHIIPCATSPAAGDAPRQHHPGAPPVTWPQTVYVPKKYTSPAPGPCTTCTLESKGELVEAETPVHCDRNGGAPPINEAGPNDGHTIRSRSLNRAPRGKKARKTRIFSFQQQVW